jgi:decaprenylphospho-beta-D-ribofuranose 2-oxidase
VPELLTGWGRTAPTAATVVAASSLPAALADPPARGILARGLGRSYGDAAQNAGGIVVAMASGGPAVPTVDGATGRVTVNAAATFDELLRFLVPRGWFVPVTPGTRQITVGGAVAADVHGKNHAADRSWMDHVTALDLALPGGEVRTVSPAADSDRAAFWATAGGMGLTGVVTACSFRAIPIETSRMIVDTRRLADLDAVLDAMAASTARYRVAWLDGSARRARAGRGVLAEAEHAPRDVVDDDPLVGAPHSLPAPPVRLVNRCSIAAFNRLRYRTAPAHRSGEVRTIASFFYPLDAFTGWNRWYGRRGLVQWQCAVPGGQDRTLAEVLGRLHEAGFEPVMTVLKCFGDGNDGPLSFPARGWSLAVDLPADPALAPVLDGLDRLVVDHGGRIYLAKDARLDPGLVRAMYPRLDEWRAVRDRLDPAGVMQSDLGRRLGLTR